MGGVTPQLWGEAFAFKSVVTNLHCRANASPLPANFRGEGSDPSLIRQQLHGIRVYTNEVRLRGLTEKQEF